MSLKTLFEPSSIAILGVSSDTKKVGYLVAKNMLEQGFGKKEGQELYFINPKGEEVLGKQCIKSIGAIEKKVDLAVLCTPAKISLELLIDIKNKGCNHIVLFAAGFKEAHDSEGDGLEQELLKKIHELELTLLGPNCIGYVNTRLGINATFFKYSAVKGNIGFISQSGALGSVLIDSFTAHNTVGFSYFISLGNKSNIDETDTLMYLADDDNTKVIGMYIEDVKRGNEFKKALKYATKRKTVIILKSGTTSAGSAAALSHTGGLLGDDSVFSSVFKECGAIRVDTFEEMMATLTMVSLDRVPLHNTILVLSNAGGVGVLLADDIVAHGLQMETLTEKQITDIKTKFPSSKKISLHNPIDVLGDASAFDYKAVLDGIKDDKDVGAVIVLLTPQANTQIRETAETLIATQKEVDFPIYPVFMGDKSLGSINDVFEHNGLVHFRTYTHATAALAKLCNKSHIYEEFNIDATSIAKNTFINTVLERSGNKEFLNVQDSFAVLELSGIPVESPVLTLTKEETVQKAKMLGLPVVLKLHNDELTHKTEVKGVYTGIGSLRYLEQCYDELQKVGSGAYIQKQLSGRELFIGAKRDNTFGTVVVLGLGGIYTELLKETVIITNKVTEDMLNTYIAGTKLQSFIDNFRGNEPLNKEQLVNTINNIFLLFEAQPKINELDCNPAIIEKNTLKVVDARIILK